jgi:hypothetical protein
MTGMGKVRIPT